MTYIGLYEWTMETGVPAYRGLYRGNSVIRLPQSRATEAFFRVARDGSSAAYTEENFLLLKEVYAAAKPRYPRTDLLLFSDAADFPEPGSEWEKLGFDICADSRYHSPLGGGLRDALLSAAAAAGLLSASAPELRLNGAGLFSSREDALTFTGLCVELQRSGAYEIESETNWRPWCVWRYAGE